MSGRKVTIKSLSKKYKTATFFSCPHQVGRGKYAVGLNHLPADLKNSKHIVKPTDRPAINHTMTLDLDNEQDHCLYAYLLDNPEVANTIREAIPDVHLFYIEDPEKDAKESNTRDDLLMQAFDLISSNKSTDTRDKILYFLGNDPRGKSDEIKKQLIFSTAKNNPQRIIDAFSKSAKYVEFVNRLHMNGIIKQENNIFYFNEHVLGNGNKEAVLYVMNEKNSVIVDQLTHHLASAEGGSTTVDLNETLKLDMGDGELIDVDEKKADELLAEYNITAHPAARLKGKVKALQQHLKAIKS